MKKEHFHINWKNNYNKDTLYIYACICIYNTFYYTLTMFFNAHRLKDSHVPFPRQGLGRHWLGGAPPVR